MKTYNKICVGVVTGIILLFVTINIYIINFKTDNSSRTYRVEVSRVSEAIKDNGYENLKLSEYETILGVYPFTEDNSENFYSSDNDYLIEEINGTLYRIEYEAETAQGNTKLLIIVNSSLAVMTLITVGVLVYVRREILQPFTNLREVPYELSKGNLTVPLKENKNKYFGRFTWGLDLLRENLEQQKAKELELQKEKKTLLLSLSHDIKTPLSAIKLYSKALSKGLYTDTDKQLEIAENINQKADEIEGYVSQIIQASNEDFLNLQVENKEFYLSEALNEITHYYSEKLELAKTSFTVDGFTDCLVKGDPDRLVEVLQNIMENAIKYGDGHSIQITFSEEEDCRLITIKNTGCTLSENELPHIFDSFWRGSNKGNTPGSGLGLYICRQLMRKMDGEIFAEVKEDMMQVTVVVRKA